MPPYSLPKYITYGTTIYTPVIVERIAQIFKKTFLSERVWDE
jgi:DNA replicative helicase MCM subunit Mcm2 (Cdc46/Mcm family)